MQSSSLRPALTTINRFLRALIKALDRTKNRKVIAIIAAAGRGKRLKLSTFKPLVKVKNKPILFFVLEVLSAIAQIKEIILVCNKDNLKKISSLVKIEGFKKVKGIILGGATRKDSVANGLKLIQEDSNTFVLIHDAARPFINRSQVNKLIREAFKYNAVISAVPVKFTVKRAKEINGRLVAAETLERKGLWEIHTPQIFRSDLLKKAFKRFGHLAVTDDASLLERLGVRAKIVKGSYANIKITTREDLNLAENLARYFRWNS